MEVAEYVISCLQKHKFYLKNNILNELMSRHPENTMPEVSCHVDTSKCFRDSVFNAFQVLQALSLKAIGLKT